MNVTPLGLVTVATHNTPVPLASTPITCAKLMISVPSTNTGIIKVKAANGTVIRELKVLSDYVTFELCTHADQIYLNQYSIDTTVDGEGAYVTYWTL